MSVVSESIQSDPNVDRLSIITTEPWRMAPEEAMRWYRTSHSWLLEWLRSVHVIEGVDESDMQMFRETRDGHFRESDPNPMIKEMISDLSREKNELLLRALVFSVKSSAIYTGMKEPLVWMAGFIDQKNRIPRPEDKVRVIVNRSTEVTASIRRGVIHAGCASRPN